MPKFNYIASTTRGETSRGVLSAANKSDLAKQLKTKGLFLVSCRSDEEAQEAPDAVVRRAEPMRSNASRVSSSGVSSSGISSSGGSFWDWITSIFDPNRKTDPNI